MEKGKLIVISGPSGVGKGTICNKLINELKAEYSISYTTREPRTGEINGVNYNFISKEEFERMIKNNDLLEYNIYNNNYYGTSKSNVINKIDKGINIFLEIDVNGAKQIKNIFNDALLIYIAPPSLEDLKTRLINRGTESIDKINERLAIANEEMKQIQYYDYIVINNYIDRATAEIKNIILKNIGGKF